MFVCRSFVVSQYERLPWGTLFCCVSEKFRSRINYWISWEGVWGRREYHDLLSKFFVSGGTERLHCGTLLCCVSEKYRSRKNLLIKWEGVGERGSITVFCQN